MIKHKKKRKIFIGLGDIANIPMTFKQAFEENGAVCDYYTWSTTGKNPFEFETDKILFLFGNKPPLRIFEKNPFLMIDRILRFIYFLYVLFKYDYFFFLSPKSFFRSNSDLGVLRFFRKKVILIFTGCTERDINFNKDDEDYICHRCRDKGHQKYLFCNELSKKKNLVHRLEKYSDHIIGQDDITNFVEDKSKLVWLYLISDIPEIDVNIEKKYDEKEIRIVHFPSNPLVKQSHIIVPILDKFKDRDNVKIIIKDSVWSRERIINELSKAHILVNALGTGYNTLPIEAMSYGCVVLNSHPAWFRKKVPNAPIYHITAKSLYNDIDYLLAHQEILKEYAIKSIEYYNEVHTPRVVGKFYLRKLGVK